MAANQLIDTLTAHISYYNLSSPSTSQSVSTNPNPRNSILKWFSSLTVHQRQSHLTVVDSNFTQLLLQMQGKIRTQGHGFFIILPDLPSPDCPNLPSLCYRRSRGMLSRVSMSNKSERSMYDSIRLFESGEGESIKDCSCPVSFIDSVTVSEEFVEDLDRFVLVMDEVSNGQFLRGEENGLGSDWVELKWLKAKGYYSLEAFVANRFDVALRLSWMNCNYGKKKGGKLKEKVTASVVASNIFWRKKGCMDWWAKLDAGVRRKVLQFVLGKTAKSLTDEILRGTLGALEEERWLFSVGSEQPLRYHTTVSRQMTKPSLLETVSEFSSTISFSSVSEQSKSFVKVLRGLLVLQDISALISACKDGDYGREKLFFTSLASVCTISDCLLRKIRGILLSVSLDCTRLELLGDGNLKLPTEKPKEKSNASSRRKKGKARKFKGMNLASSAAAHDKSVKDQGCELARIQHVDMMGSDQVVGAHQEKNINRQALLQAVQMDNGQGSGGKVPTAARKNKKRSNKNKEDKSKKPGSARHLTVQMEVAKTDRMSESSLLQNANADVSTGNDNLLPNSSPFISRSGPKEVDGPAQIIQGDFAADSPSTPLMDLRTLQENGNAKCDVEKVGEADTKSVFTAKPIKAIDSKDGFTPVQQKFGKYYDTGPINSSVYPSHEWPSIAPHQYPSFNSNLPATTDRLHLDVGRNWILPPSLDWPPMELADDWEEEFEVHAVSNRDYNQYFGGGVMYWNSSDRFSRPPSLCSDDSSWARHEADMNVAVDDIIAFSSSSTMTESASEEKVSGFSDVEGKSVGDSLPYHILRPIVIPNMSRERSRSEFKHSHRIKRPPSPMVLCVPGPPPPSPVKHRGFPTVRSGSSSPRNWMCMDGSEVVWPSWRKKGISGCPIIQPLPGALLQDRLIAMSQLARDQDHPDVALPLQPPELLKCPTRNSSLSTMHNLLHDEIDSFCKRVAAENLSRKPYVNWAVKRVTRSLQVLWPRSRTNIFGSNATGLSLPTSDVDLVVCLPPVRNLEPIKEAGILEGRNGIKETCLQHAARYLANQEWVKTDSLKTVENTAIPIIMLVVEVPHDIITSSASLMTNDGGKNAKSVRLDISFKSPTHTGLQTTELVKELTEQFPAAMPLALVLKQFLADRSLDHSYSGGLSSYCLVLLITRFLQHEHHLGRPINQNFGSLLMDFLYFFGNVFDPRHMRISVQGSGLYINRERGYSIDPIHIDDPLFPTNNVGRNCFRIHQCTKAFSDAYTILEKELSFLQKNDDSSVKPSYRLLPKIIPNIDLYI